MIYITLIINVKKVYLNNKISNFQIFLKNLKNLNNFKHFQHTNKKK